MKVLITGATGLLGSDIAYVLDHNDKAIFKTCFSERGKDYIAADITSPEGIKKLENLEWDYVVHTSAWKSPDKCENFKDETYRLNVWAAEEIAKLSKSRNAGMLFISTDYVFSGNNPPYSETDIPKPINYYGETKRIAEKKLLSISDEFIILRVPLLYGVRAGLKASDVLYTAINSLSSTEPRKMDNTITRYPTYTGDVAEAVNFLIDKKAQGIYHFSGQDKTTKYGICKHIAEVLGKSMVNIIKMEEPPNDDAKRPLDSHITMNKILNLGFQKPKSFKERLRELTLERLL